MQESGQYICHLLTVVDLDFEPEVSCTGHMSRKQNLEHAKAQQSREHLKRAVDILTVGRIMVEVTQEKFREKQAERCCKLKYLRLPILLAPKVGVGY